MVSRGPFQPLPICDSVNRFFPVIMKELRLLKGLLCMKMSVGQIRADLHTNQV